MPDQNFVIVLPNHAVHVDTMTLLTNGLTVVGEQSAFHVNAIQFASPDLSMSFHDTDLNFEADRGLVEGHVIVSSSGSTSSHVNLNASNVLAGGTLSITGL